MPARLRRQIEARLSGQGKLGAALVKGAAGSAGLKVFHAGVGFVTTVLLAKLLGPSGFGIYAYVMALTGFLTIPTRLGIPGLSTREVAVTAARRDWSHMRGFIVRAHQAIAVLTVVMVISGVIVLSFWLPDINPRKRACIFLGLALIPIISLSALRAGMLRGLRKVVLSQLPEELIRPLAFVMLIAPLTVLPITNISAVHVMGLQIIATFVSFLCGVYLFLRYRPAPLVAAQPEYHTLAWLKSSLPFALMAALQLINGQTDILVLGLYRTDAEVGVYRIAVQMAAMMIFGLKVVNSIQGPHIAHLYAKGDMRRLQLMVTRSSQAILAITVPAMLIVILLGRPIISTVFGPEYSGAYVPLAILCVGQLVNAATGSVGSLLTMTGHERDTTKAIMAGAAVNVVLNFALTPKWGMNGAAVATATTLMVWNLTMWRLVRRRLGIQASPVFRKAD